MSQEQLMHFKKEFHRHYKSNAEVEHVFQIRRKQEKDLEDYKILVKVMREKNNKLNIDNQKIKNELIIYYGKEKTKQAGVDIKYIDFITYKILSLTDNIDDFEIILNHFLNTHDEYKNSIKSVEVENKKSLLKGYKDYGI
ncbi:MAG: hypothetical protein ACLSBH_10690 [Coprobacillus cateniformis]